MGFQAVRKHWLLVLLYRLPQNPEQAGTQWDKGTQPHSEVERGLILWVQTVHTSMVWICRRHSQIAAPHEITALGSLHLLAHPYYHHCAQRPPALQYVGRKSSCPHPLEGLTEQEAQLAAPLIILLRIQRCCLPYLIIHSFGTFRLF